MQLPTVNCSISALRFLFTVTLDRPYLSGRLVLVRHPRKLPSVLSVEVEEVGRLLEAAPGPKYKAALGSAYGAGLRVSEVAALKVGDIDSTRVLMRVDRGEAARTATRCYRRSCWGCSGCGKAKASAPVSCCPSLLPISHRRHPGRAW